MVPLAHERVSNFIFKTMFIQCEVCDAMKIITNLTVRSPFKVIGAGIFFLWVSAAEASPVPSSPPASSLACPAFSAIANTLKPTTPESSFDAENTAASATSTCAADLKILSAVPLSTPKPSDINLAQIEDRSEPPSEPPQGTESPSPDASEGLQVSRDRDRWHFKFQPYVTIPVNTYGTVTVRGQSVNYSLGLGQLLNDLRVTASGRVEAWKGRWGFIVDGYYASLQGIGSFDRISTREPQPIDVVDYVLSKGVNTRVTELATALDREVQALQEVEEIKDSPTLQILEGDVQTLQSTLAGDAAELQTLATNINTFQETLAQSGQELQGLTTALQSSLEDLQLTSQDKEDINRAIALNLSTLQGEREQLQSQIQSLGTIPSVSQVQQDLTQIQTTLTSAEQRVRELRQVQDSPQLQQLETDIASARAAVERELQDIERIQTFQENRKPQQLDADVSTDLQFDQGIYDFAVSYHFGPELSYEYPEKPSGRSFPLLWFQAIAGVRLNDINAQIQNDIDYEISSTLVNIRGSSQNTYQQGRTWFEPMLGGKLGLQLSDLWTLWLRGDVSGFGLAGQTDLSWNLFFGVDWWVRKNLSLQAAYRFYSIEYKNGTGENAFGFSENFNGPFLSATLHF